MGRSIYSLSALLVFFIYFNSLPVKAALSTQVGASTTLMAENLLFSGFDFNTPDMQSTHPATLATLEKSQSSFHLFSTNSNFKKNSDIVVQNSATSGATQRIDSYDPNPVHQFMFAYHYGTPLSNYWWLKSVGISFIAPLPELVILDTTSSFLPKYYWYDSRLNKSEVLVNLAQKISSNVSTSVSLYGQWDLVAQSEVTTGTQGGTASSARLQGKLRPRFYPMLNILWRENKNILGISWSASSKQKIQNSVTGRAPLGSSSTVDYTFIMDSNSNIEPMRLKIDYTYKLTSDLNLLSGLTYEDWSDLNSSTLQITNSQGAITNSSQFESLSGKQIISPAIGLEVNTEMALFNMSYRFLPKVINKDNNLSGNTIDLDKHILGLGIKKSLNLFERKTTWSLASQIHYLASEKIAKNTGQEDGNTGLKIGSPGYEVGGYFMVLALGFEHTF